MYLPQCLTYHKYRKQYYPELTVHVVIVEGVPSLFISFLCRAFLKLHREQCSL